MIDPEQFLHALGLSDIAIERVVFEEGNVLKIDVTSVKAGCQCHRCGSWIEDFFALGEEISLRHLPMFGHQVFIVLRPKRYRCPHCEGRPTTTQQLDWDTPRSRMTKAFEQEVLLSLINSSVEDVSRKQALGPDAIEGVLDRHVAEQVDWTGVAQLPILGIDEIALRQGHRDFVTIVSARLGDGQLTILAILADRTKATVEAFFKSIPKRLRRTVELVCSDLHAGFLSAAKAVFGRRVAVCADRFHIAKLDRDGVESLRKKERRRLKRELPKTAYDALKNVHWILRKSDADLSADERRIRRRVFDLSPKLAQAHALSEALTAL